MTAEDLKNLHAEYRQAVEATRHPESDEAAEKAAAHMLDLRHKLDAALIAKEEEREDEARMAAVEAREAAARKMGEVRTEKAGSIVNDELRSFARKETNQFNTVIPFAESRDALSWSTAASGVYGSYTVDTSVWNTVQRQLLAQSGVLQAGPRIIQTAGGNQINIPLLTAANTPVGIAGAENVAATLAHPVFTTAALNAYRIDGAFGVSEELLDDTAIDINGLMSELAGDALGQYLADYLADVSVGTGSTLPHAIFIHSTSGKTAASVDSWTIDEAKELYYSVLPQYRQNGRWIANSDLTLEAACWKDDNGGYLWQPSNMAAEPDRLFGKAFYEDSHIASSATGVKAAGFGDVAKAYWVRFAHGGMEFSLSRDYAFLAFSVTARFAIWVDAMTVDAIAFKHLTLG